MHFDPPEMPSADRRPMVWGRLVGRGGEEAAVPVPTSAVGPTREMVERALGLACAALAEGVKREGWTAGDWQAELMRRAGQALAGK